MKNLKYLLFTFCFVFLCLISDAQSNGRLFCTYWNGNAEIFASIEVDSKVVRDIAALKGVQSIIMGETTIDLTYNRYFNITNLGITVISGQTGNIMDTISNSLHLKGIEYIQGKNQVIGTYWDGQNEILTILDLGSKTFTDLSPLSNVTSVYSGQSTFDAKNNRYFIITNLGITMIDAVTGEIISTFRNNKNVKGIEYDSTSNKLFGTYWNGSKEVFTSLNLVNGSFEDLDVLNGITSTFQGTTTYDNINQRYFSVTNRGITNISSDNGRINSTIENVKNLKGFEFSQTYIYDLISNDDISIFPNPFREITLVKFSHEVNNGTIRILNLKGQVVYEDFGFYGNQFVFSRGQLMNGVYFFYITENKNKTITKKIIIID